MHAALPHLAITARVRDILRDKKAHGARGQTRGLWLLGERLRAHDFYGDAALGLKARIVHHALANELQDRLVLDEPRGDEWLGR